MDTNPTPQPLNNIAAPAPATPPPMPVVPAAEVVTVPNTVVTPAMPAAPGTPNLVLVQLPFWKNPRMYIAAAAAIIIIVAGIYFSKGNALKGSFDSFDPTLDYKIQSFTITQPADGSFQIAYKIDKKASNLFMAITKPADDDLPENDEMIKLIALSDSDLAAGEHKVTLTPDDLKATFATSGIYRFQIIAYNNSDEITDFKAEKRTINFDNKGTIKLAVPTK